MSSPDETPSPPFAVWHAIYADDLKPAYDRMVDAKIIEPNSMSFDNFLEAIYRSTNWPTPTLH